jgi:hypothetical protein
LLVGYWKFDEGSGTVAYDSSGNNKTGTIVNAPTWVAGKLGSALDFNGIDSYVKIPDNLIRNTDPITVSVSFNTSSEGIIIGCRNTEYPDNPSNFVPVIYVGVDGKLRGELYMGSKSPTAVSPTYFNT